MKKLDPEIIKSNLVRCSLYLTAFEFLKMSVIDSTWDFLTMRYFDDEEAAKKRFKEEVMERFAPRNEKGKIIGDKFAACSGWLAWMKAVKEDDINVLISIREHRNLVAHELPNLLLKDDKNFDEALFHELQRLHRAIRLFWAKIDIDCNDEFDGAEIKDEDIGTPAVSLIDYIADIIQMKKPD